MANPLSSRGWSDRDYAAAIGTLMGEAAVRGTLQDYQAIADVIANRVEAGVYGKTVAGVTMNPSQFSTWSPREKGAYQNAVMGFTAALNPDRVSMMPASVQERFSFAQQALDDVVATGIARGLTQGATAYHNASVTAKLGTDTWHKGLEDKYGSVTIGAHTFTGPGFRPDQPFDPVTYNGQLGVPPAAEAFFGDLGAPPIGNVEFAGNLPDLSPASAGFSLAGATLPDDLSLDFGQFGAPDFSSITAGTAFDNFPGFSPAEQAPVNVSDVDLGTYPDITESLYSDPLANVSTQAADWGSMPESYGPSLSEMGATGYHAGLDAGPYGQTPDFSAPSLDARNAMDKAQGALQGAALGMGPYSSDLNNEAIAASVMSELGPQVSAPALAEAPLSAPSTQVASLDSFTPSMASQTPSPSASANSWGGFAGLGGLNGNALGQAYDNYASATQPQTQTQTHSLSPSTSPIGWGDKGLTVAGYQSPIDAVKEGLGLATTPSTAPTSGLFDGWSTPGLVAGGLGLVAGGIPGAIAGYQAGKLGASLFDGLFGGSGYQGSGLAGDTYSNDKGFTDPGGWSLGNLGDLSGFATGSAYGPYGPSTPGGLAGFLSGIFGPPDSGGGGGFSQGGWGAEGPGYGTADGSPGTNGPGIW